MKEEVNETLNQIITNISSGVNYASDIAKKTQKSIPVMFRQLESLIKKGLLTKKREGKKVEYFIKWPSLAKIVSSFIKEEFITASENLSQIKIPKILLNDLPEVIKSVFSTPYFQEIFKEMYIEIQNAGKVSYEYLKVNLNESVDLILETFGVLEKSKEKEILNKIPEKDRKKFKKFFEISKTHKRIKDEVNPVNKIRKKL